MEPPADQEEAVKAIPQERISERIAEQIVGGPAPEKIVHQERISERIAEQIVDVPVPKIESPDEAGSSLSRTSDTTSTAATAVDTTVAKSVGEARPTTIVDTTDAKSMDVLRELTSHNPLDTWAQHIQSQQLVVAVVFSCPWLYLCFCPWAGCDLALSLTCLTIHEYLFATGLEMDCSSCTLLKTNTGLSCGRFATTLGLKSKSFVHFSFALRATTFPKLYGTPLSFPPFAGPLPTGAMNPAWFLSSRENSSVASQ